MPNILSVKSMTLAKNAITREQMWHISNLYNEWADELAKKADEYARMTTPSSYVSEMQARELEMMMRAQSQQIINNQYKVIKDATYRMSDLVVNGTGELMKKMGFTDKGIGVAFGNINNEVVQSLFSGQVYKGGWNLSASIWGDNQDTLAKLYEIVAGGIARNENVYDIAKLLEEFVRPGAKKAWNWLDKDGKLIYPKQVDFNAQRLVRTLGQHGYQQSLKQTMSDNPFIKKFRWIANGSRACDLCKERNGKVYTIEDMPLDHPQGMCVMEPIVDFDDDDLTSLLADWIKSDDGDYPEIDRYARKFGYNGMNKSSIVSL